MDRNRVALGKAQAAEQSFGAHMGHVTAEILGVSSAQQKGSRHLNWFTKGLLAASLASGPLESTVASLTTVLGGLAAGAVIAGTGIAAYAAAAYPAIQGVAQAVQAQGKIQAAQTAAQNSYQASLAAAQARYKLDLGAATTAAQRNAAGQRLLSAQHTALVSKVRATTAANQQYQAQLAGLSPVQRQLATGLVGAKNAYEAWAKPFARPILMPFIRMLVIARPLLDALSPAVRQAAAAVEILSNQFISVVQGGGFQRWVKAVSPSIAPILISLGHIAGHLVVTLGGITRAFAPAAVIILQWLDKMTGRLAVWAQTLTRHTGFQQLVDSFRRNGPVLAAIAGNLIAVLGNVSRAWATMITPSNSRALLMTVLPLSQFVALLSRNQGLVQALTYLYLIRNVASRLAPAFTTGRVAIRGVVATLAGLRSGGAEVKGLAGWVGRLRDGFNSSAVAGSAFSGFAGTLGGKLRIAVNWLKNGAGAIRSWTVWSGIATVAQNVFSVTIGRAALAIRSWTIWSKIAAVATRVWAAVVAVFNAVMDANPIALVVIAIAALVAGVIYAYHRFRWFRDFVNGVGRFIAAHWQLMLAVITGGLSLAVTFIAGHWGRILAIARTVINWVRGHWALLLIALTGPLGAAVVLIVQHWNSIWHAAKSVTGLIGAAWGGMVGFLRRAARAFETMWFNVVAGILDKARAGFGWLPFGIGRKITQAANTFDRLRTRWNAVVRGMHDRTVRVGINMYEAGGVRHPGPRGTGGPGFARGGPVRGPGGPDDDKAGLYALSDNEYIVRARAHRKYGTRFLDLINRGQLPDEAVHFGRRARGGPARAGMPAIDVRVKIPTGQDMAGVTRRPLQRLAQKWADSQLFGGMFTSALGRMMLQYASRFAGRVPYVWGGATPAGWDCSGFISWLYEHFRLLSGRMVSQSLQQWATPSGPVPGGMVFFGNPAYHVGLVAGNGRMLSALGRRYGTIFSGMAGNSGYGLPPHGFGLGSAAGGAAGGVAFWQAVGREMAARYGWTGWEWTFLQRLWNRESRWDPNARNPSSGAAGIPQDITGNMHGGGRGQIAWGLNYIRNRYGDPLGAWAHEVYAGSYDRGGLLPPGVSLAVNNTGRAERVIAPGQDRPDVTVNVGPVTVTERADVELMARRLAFGISAAGFA